MRKIINQKIIDKKHSQLHPQNFIIYFDWNVFYMLFPLSLILPFFHVSGKAENILAQFENEAWKSHWIVPQEREKIFFFFLPEKIFFFPFVFGGSKRASVLCLGCDEKKEGISEKARECSSQYKQRRFKMSQFSKSTTQFGGKCREFFFSFPSLCTTRHHLLRTLFPFSVNVYNNSGYESRKKNFPTTLRMNVTEK